MAEFLYGIDVALFRFLNGTLGNPVSDVVMPFLTDLNHSWAGRALFVAAWLLLVVRGGKPGRAAAFLLVILVAVGDQLSSNLLKQLFSRPRPCHAVDGAVMVGGIRLLVDCGGGLSFPSSHAVNHFSAATLLAHYYPRWTPWFFSWAALIGISRVSVGVHYPSDVAGGALFGVVVACGFILVWKSFREMVPALRQYGPAAAPAR